MKILTNLIMIGLFSLSTAFASETHCNDLTQSSWESDSFNASFQAAYLTCKYTGTAQFYGNADQMTATLHFHKIKGNSMCDAELNYDLMGTCSEQAYDPITLRNSDAIWHGYWAQSDRISLDSIILMGNDQIKGLLSVYMIKS